MVNWLVPQVHLKEDDSVDLDVDIADIGSGNWAEISGYIIGEDTIQGSTAQENSLFAPFSAIRQVPDAVDGASFVTVNVPALKLNTAADIKVITRVAEVQIWATRLRPATAAERTGPGIRATWEAQDFDPWRGRDGLTFP